MKRIFYSVFCLAVITLIFQAPNNPAQAQADAQAVHKPAAPQGNKFVRDEVLIKFKSPPPAPDMPAKEHFRPLTGAKAKDYVAAMPAKARKALEEVQGKVVRVHPHMGLARVKLPKGSSVGQAIEALYRSGAVEYAEANYLVTPQATFPNDPSFSQQWGLDNAAAETDINAPEAWGAYRTDGSDTVVALIDSGVEYNHPDLAANIWINQAELNNRPGLDDDSNNWVDDIYGINTTVTPSNVNPMDDYGHGTGLAGVIGAVGNNGLGVCGVNWTARIMALKFLDKYGTGTVEGAITCINYALVKKAYPEYPIPRMVMILAWKQNPATFSNGLYDAIRIAQEAGVLMVSAAGNDDIDSDFFPNYPGAYNLPNIINVGGSDNGDRRIGYVDLKVKGSNYGIAAVDLFAPGKAVFSTNVKGTAANYDNAYRSFTGTSMAAGHVAGAAALLWSQYPDLDWKQVKAMLLNGVDDGLTKDFKAICLTEGRLNLNNSLNPGLLGAPAIFSVAPSQAQAGDTITITGINFGPRETGTLTFQGKAFRPEDIISWTQGADFDRIQVKIPAKTVIPQGVARLILSNTNGASRGASLANISMEKVVGHLILPRGHATGAQVGSYFYVIGGNCGYGLTGHVEKYSFVTHRTMIDSLWMMPTPVSNAGAAAIGNSIYVVGGLGDFGIVDKLQILDTTTMTWSEGPPLPKALMQTAVVNFNDKLYVFGGLDKTAASTAALKTAYVYDPANGVWTALAPMLQPAAYAAAAPYGLKKIWVMGGFSKNTFGTQITAVQEYNPATDKWVLKTHMVRGRGGAGAINYSTNVFCLHGCVAAPSPNTTKYDAYADGEWFNPSAGYWMPSIERYVGPYVKDWIGSFTPGVGKWGPKIFVVGGITGTAPAPYDYYVSNNVWAFTRP